MPSPSESSDGVQRWPPILPKRRSIARSLGVVPRDRTCSFERVQCWPPIHAPTVPAPPDFKESSPAAYSSAPPGTWQPAQPQDAVLKGKWWEMFNEPELNALEDQLNIDNQNIAQYFQNFMAARAQVSEARAGFFPTVTADPAVSKGRSGWERCKRRHDRDRRRRPSADPDLGNQFSSADRRIVGAGPMGPRP